MEDVIDTTVDAELEEVVNPRDEVEDNESESDKGEKESANAEQKPTQDSETNSKFADMRRKIEAAEARARKADEVVSKTWGSRGITTLEQLEVQLEKERQEAEHQEWIDKGVDPSEIEQLIEKKLNDHPSVVAARQSEINGFVNAQIDELNSRYSLGLKTVEDINDLPNAEAMVKKMNQGYEWHEAYLVTHQDHLTTKTAERAKQAALNNQNSKSHLKTTTGGGDVDTFHMPPETLSEYKRMFSKELRKGTMTEKDFISHYRKSNGK